MPFEIWKNSTQMAHFTVSVVFTPLGVLVTLLRFYATKRAGRNLGFEDWMAALGTFFFVLVDFCSLMALAILNGRSIVVEIEDSLSDYKRMRQWDMASLYFYFFHTLFVKLSVLGLYYRIFGVSKPYRIWIYVIGGAQTLLVALACIFQGFQCRPIAKYFDATLPGTCTDEGTIILGGELPNSVIDFAMIVLVMYMIRPRQMRAATKLRLRILFGMGSVVAVIGFIKIAVTYSTSDIYAFSWIAIWSAIQMFVSILCCCLPVFNSLFPRQKPQFWSRLTSKLASAAALGRASRERASSYFMKGSNKQSGEIGTLTEMGIPYDSFERRSESDEVGEGAKSLYGVGQGKIGNLGPLSGILLRWAFGAPALIFGRGGYGNELADKLNVIGVFKEVVVGCSELVALILGQLWSLLVLFGEVGAARPGPNIGRKAIDELDGFQRRLEPENVTNFTEESCGDLQLYGSLCSWGLAGWSATIDVTKH